MGKGETLSKILRTTLVCLTIGSLFAGLVETVSAISKPTVETRPATSISKTGAVINGRIVNDGGSGIIERRFDWGTNPSGEGWTDWTADVSVSGNYFSYYLSGLNPGTTYYFRAWAKNSAGWGWGEILSFTTSQQVQKPDPPTPTSPGLSSPPGPTIDTLTPTFRWNGVSGVDYYALAISEYPYGPSHVIYRNEQIYGTSFPLPSGVLEYGEKYRWNMQSHNSAGWSDISITLYFQTAAPPDTTAPTVDAFSVHPDFVTLGNAFTIDYTVSDTGGSGLNRTELWRANDSGGSPVDWTEIKRTSISGNSYSGSFSDFNVFFNNS